MRICSSDRARGLTLVEVAIAVSIMSVIFIGAIAVFLASAKMQQQNFLYQTVFREARKTADWLTTDAREAVTVEGSFTSGSDSFTSNATTLILRMPRLDSAGAAISNSGGSADHWDRVVYHTDSRNRVLRSVYPHASSTRLAEKNRVLAQSANRNMSIAGTYATQPDALGAFIIHYEFRAVRNVRQRASNTDYRAGVAGSVYLRNRPSS